MPDIIHEFWVASPASEVFAAVATPDGLAHWWTRSSTGRVETGAEYLLDFGASHRWAGVLTQCVPEARFELRITQADADWTGTLVGFALKPEGARTRVTFHHTGWPTANEHWRVSSYCWAMYLRIMRRYVEHGEVVPYGKRLEA